MEKTVWEKIYKLYKAKSRDKHIVEEKIHPVFLKVVKQKKFPRKVALDIGCGMGDYLKILKDAGFKVEGIDSSRTAVRTTRRLLGQTSGIRVADMYKYRIPANRYGLVISIRTLHHGSKDQIKKLISRIYSGLLRSGILFFTVPTSKTLYRWKTFKGIKFLSEGTFYPKRGPEKGLIHSVFRKKEIKELLSKFRDVSIKEDDMDRWAVSASK